MSPTFLSSSVVVLGGDRTRDDIGIVDGLGVGSSPESFINVLFTYLVNLEVFVRNWKYL